MKNFHIHNTKHFVFAAVAAVSLASVAMAAKADQAVDAPARTVHYSDLNLNTQAGVAKLYNRIRNAAQLVCGDVDPRRLDEAASAKACIDRAVFSSVTAVNNPKLTSEYNARVSGAQKQINFASIR
jgi:UrcA family protein